VRCPPGGQCGQVVECEAGAPGVESACFHLPPQYRCDFEVGEFGPGQPLAVQSGPGLVPVGAVIGQGGDQDAGVSDDHGRRGSRLRRDGCREQCDAFVDLMVGQVPVAEYQPWPRLLAAAVSFQVRDPDAQPERVTADSLAVRPGT
jgi:hypothetical protein